MEMFVVGGGTHVDDLKVSVHLYQKGEAVGILRLSKEAYEELFLNITNLLAVHVRQIESGQQ